MERAQVHELVDAAWAADAAAADLATLTTTMATARRLRAALDAREMTVAVAMERHSVFPEKHVAEAATVPLSEAGRIVARSRTATEIPALAEACEQGQVMARHVDAFAKVLKHVSAPVADHMRVDAARLVDQAATMPAGKFAQLLRSEAERIEPAGDDEARLERQRRAVRLRSFTDTFGMGRWIAIGIPAPSPISSTGRMNASRRCSMTVPPSSARAIRSNANSSYAATRWPI